MKNYPRRTRPYFDMSFDLATSHNSCRELIKQRIERDRKAQKDIAGDMDYAPSQLSRKLYQNPTDTARFTLDDFELYTQVTGDVKPLLYLVEKYLDYEINGTNHE